MYLPNLLILLGKTPQCSDNTESESDYPSDREARVYPLLSGGRGH